MKRMVNMRGTQTKKIHAKSPVHLHLPDYIDGVVSVEIAQGILDFNAYPPNNLLDLLESFTDINFSTDTPYPSGHITTEL